MTGKLGVFFLCVLFLFSFTGCTEHFASQPQQEFSSSQQDSSRTDLFPYTFTDSTGQQVTLQQRPRRVAVIFSSYADIWQLSGGEVAVTVGDSVKRGLVKEDAPLVDDGAGLKIDVELLLAQEPDFVIASADMGAQVEACEQLRAMGIPCAALKEESFEDYLTLLKLFTEINSSPQAYENYGLQIADEIGILLSELGTAREEVQPLKVLFIRAGSGYSSTRAKTAKDHFVGKMLEVLGTVNIADEAGALSEGLALESVLINQPDVILIVPQGDEESTRAYMDGVLTQNGWRDLDAVREGRYHYLSKDLFHYKPNARWAEAYHVLAKLLYPEIFA